jgi:hypothetical protein
VTSAGPFVVDTASKVPAKLGPDDDLMGLPGTLSPIGNANNITAPTTIVAGPGMSVLLATGNNSLVEWIDISGAVGLYQGGAPQPCPKPSTKDLGCPIVGTGTNIRNPDTSRNVTLRYVVSHHAENTGINGGAKVVDSELHNNSFNTDFHGFTAAAMKADEEYEVDGVYAHDNYAIAFWCDQGCNDRPEVPNGFWVHDSVITNNDEYGIRYEWAPMVGEGVYPDQPTALIENNYILGSRLAGITVADAQNATVRNNIFGGITLNGVSYPHNKPGNGPVAVRFHDSGRTDRTDLWNGVAHGNDLNGERIVGCELPNNVVNCYDNTP